MLIRKRLGARPCMPNMSFAEGKSYSNFKSLDADIHLYELKEFVNLRKGNSHLLSTYKAKNSLIQHYKDELLYYDIEYVCKHGGEFRPHRRNSDIANDCSTIKKNCPFKLRFRASTNGENLVCVKTVLDHNHAISKENFEFDYTQRKLDDQTKQQIAQIAELKGNRKLIRKHFADATGKKILLKDIHNISAQQKNSKQDGNDLEQLHHWLEETYPDVTVEYVTDDDILVGIFMQDGIMKNIFQAYPEILLIDAKHKTNNLNFVLYAFLAIDGNGDSHVVGSFLSQDESEVSVRAMIHLFKERNPAWEKTEVIITDKDMTERQVLKEEFTQAHLQICLFHVLRTFSREISTEKLGITSAQKATAKTLIQEIAYARNEMEYINKYKNLKTAVPKAVSVYFDKNWNNIKEEWVEGFKSRQLNFLTRTNNRIESFFQKLSSCVWRQCTLKEMLENFWGLIEGLRIERRFKHVQQQEKTVISSKEQTTDEKDYKDYLTPYAFQHLQTQMEYSKKVKVIDSKTVQTSNGQLFPGKDGCTCNTFASMHLPCRHVFAILHHNNQSIFCPDLIHQRWKSSHYFKTYDEMPTAKRIAPVSTTTRPKQSALTSSQKYRKAMSHFNIMASHLVECGTAEFETKLQQSVALLQSWKNNNSSIQQTSLDQKANSNSAGTSNVHDSEVPEIVSEQSRKSSEHPQTDFCNQRENLTTESLSSSDHQSSSNNISNENVLTKIRMPPPSKKRGRPKGSLLTAIGRPRSKSRKTKHSTSNCTPFLQKTSWNRQQLMLSWFLDDQNVKKSLRSGVLCGEADVECNPDKLRNGMKDELVDINLIRRFFTDDGWLAVLNAYEQLKKKSWLCSLCAIDLLKESSVQCDSCLDWYHFSCIQITKIPACKFWFCDICKSNSTVK